MEFLQDNLLPSLRTYSTLLFRKTLTTFSASSDPEHTLAKFQQDFVEPYLLTPIANIVDSSASGFSSANILSFVILLLTLYISLRILNYARRVVTFWIMFVARLMFWMGLIGVGLWVYNVGVEKALRDAGYLWGVVQGLVEEFMANANAESMAEIHSRRGQIYNGAQAHRRGTGRSSDYWHNRNRRGFLA